MSSDIRRSGSCLCGGVQFSVTGEPLRVGLCHCKDCRKTSGSAYQAFAIWPLEAFETAGIANTYGGRSFCPTCGSRVTTVGEDEVEVMIGSLDVAPTELAPGYELWTVRREHWLQPLPGSEQFEHDRVDGAQASSEAQISESDFAAGSETPSTDAWQRKTA